MLIFIHFHDQIHHHIQCTSGHNCSIVAHTDTLRVHDLAVTLCNRSTCFIILSPIKRSQWQRETWKNACMCCLLPVGHGWVIHLVATTQTGCKSQPRWHEGQKVIPGNMCWTDSWTDKWQPDFLLWRHPVEKNWNKWCYMHSAFLASPYARSHPYSTESMLILPVSCQIGGWIMGTLSSVCSEPTGPSPC